MALGMVALGLTVACGGDDDGGGSGGSGGTTSGGSGGTTSGGSGGSMAGSGGSMAGSGGTSTGGTAGMGGSTGGTAGAGGSTGGAAGAGGSTGGAAGAGANTPKDCGGAKFVASCEGKNSSTGTCIDYYEKWTLDIVKSQCSAKGPGTLDETNKCPTTGYFGACATKVAQSCFVTSMGSPTYSSASVAADACKQINGTWYPN